MGRIVLRFGPVIAALAVAVGAAAPAIAAPGRPAGTPGWRQVKQFGPCATGEVDSVTSTGPSSAWATGSYGYCSGAGLLVGRWNGRSWQQVRPPAGFGPAIGSAVAALSNTYSWTFVNRGEGDFALLRDGGRWRTFRLVHDSTINAAAVFSRSSALAFGASYGGTAGAAYAARFNGRAWRRVWVPVVAQAISSAGRANVWAVGTRVKGGGYALAHWTGRWTTRPFPSLHLPSKQHISAAWVTHDNSGGAWIAAEITGVYVDQPVGGVLLHWTGSTWVKVALPVQIDDIGPLAQDGHGGLWITSYPTSLECEVSCNDVEMLHYSAAGAWTEPVVPVQNLGVVSIRLIPGTTSLWAGGLTVSGDGNDQFGVMIKYGP